MIRSLAIALCLLCMSCGPKWYTNRAARLLDIAKRKGADVDRHMITVRDTVYVETFRTDTLFQNVNFTDTLVHETTRTITKVKVNYQDRKVYVESECKGDTVYIEKQVPCETVTASGKPPWWLIVACLIGLACILIALIKK